MEALVLVAVALAIAGIVVMVVGGGPHGQAKRAVQLP